MYENLNLYKENFTKQKPKFFNRKLNSQITVNSKKNLFDVNRNHSV
jgi:hypothetical protein